MPVWFPPRSMGTRSGISWLSALLTRSREVIVSFFGIVGCLVWTSAPHGGSLEQRLPVNQSQETAARTSWSDGVVEKWSGGARNGRDPWCADAARSVENDLPSQPTPGVGAWRGYGGGMEGLPCGLCNPLIY